MILYVRKTRNGETLRCRYRVGQAIQEKFVCAVVIEEADEANDNLLEYLAQEIAPRQLKGAAAKAGYLSALRIGMSHG